MCSSLFIILPREGNLVRSVLKIMNNIVINIYVLVAVDKSFPCISANDKEHLDPWLLDHSAGVYIVCKKLPNYLPK
jgi:hypothetical protein